MDKTAGLQIVLAARPHGMPQLTDFRLEETTIPPPGAGQVLLAVQYLSLDPYMRGRMEDRKSYGLAAAPRHPTSAAKRRTSHGQVAGKSGGHHRRHHGNRIRSGETLRQRGGIRLHHGSSPKGT